MPVPDNNKFDQFDGWIVYVPQGAFTTVYGIFETYDVAMSWRRANGYDAETAQAHPIRRVEEDNPSTRP